MPSRESSLRIPKDARDLLLAFCARDVRFLIVGALLAAGCAAARPDASTASAPERPQVVALEPYVAGLRTIKLNVDGHDETMIFDTAGGFTLLTPEVAARAGCRPFGRLTGFRSDGTAVHLQRCAARTLELGGWRSEREVGVFDLMALLGGAPPVGGLVGLDLFEGRAITIDFGGGELILETPESLRARVRGAAKLRVRVARQAGGAALDLFVAVDAPRGPLWLEWDAGNTQPVLLSPHALAQLGVELSPEVARPLTLPVAGLGPVTLDAIERATVYDGLLNTKFFLDYVFTLDLARYELWAKPRRAAPAPGGG